MQQRLGKGKQLDNQLVNDRKNKTKQKKLMPVGPWETQK